MVTSKLNLVVTYTTYRKCCTVFGRQAGDDWGLCHGSAKRLSPEIDNLY